MYVYLYEIDVYPLHYIHKTRRVDLEVESQEASFDLVSSRFLHHASSETDSDDEVSCSLRNVLPLGPRAL
jgi:hypothetical protein